MGLGVAQYMLGDYAQAITWMERSLALSPRAVWIQRNLVPAYVGAGRMADASHGVQVLLGEYPGLSVAAVQEALVFSRPTLRRIGEDLSRAGLPRI